MSERNTKTKRTDRTRRNSPTKRVSSTKRITPTSRTLTKNLEVLDYGAGEIETDEFEQTGLTKKGRLRNKSPIESVSGIDASRGKSLRSKGIKNVGDLRKKSKSKKPVTSKSKNYAVYSRGGSFLGSYKHEEDAHKHIINDPSRYMIGYDSQGDLQDKYYDYQQQKEKNLITFREGEREAKEAELKYFIYHLDSNALITEPFSSRKEAKNKAAFLSTKRKGNYQIITAETADKATEKSKELPEYKAALKAEEDYEKELRANLVEPKKKLKKVSKTDIDRKTVQNAIEFTKTDSFKQMYKKQPDEAMFLLNQQLNAVDPEARDEFDEWFVSMDKENYFATDRDKEIAEQIAQQKARNRKVAAADRKLRSVEIKKRKDATIGRDLHSTHAQDFELGEIFYYRWTNNFNQFEGKVKIVKINPKSVRIQLLDPPKGYKKGQNWNVRLVEQTKNNGLYNLTSDETSQVQAVASKQVNVSVTDTEYKDRREFRNLGLVPDRDSDGKFIGWAGNVDPEDISKLEELGNVVYVEKPITQKKVHMDEIARLNRQLDSLEEREFKKAKQYDQLSDEIKQLADMIPLGEPIKVGHHSEKRHRKHFVKIDNKQRKRYELGQEIEKIQSQKESLERRKKTMLGRKEKEYIKPTPQSYIAGHPELKRELDHAIDKLPKDKSNAYNQKEKALKVREKLDSKKSWKKTEIRDLLRSNNIYIDLDNVSGKENWIAEANTAIDNSIHNQNKEIKAITDFEFYIKDDTTERRLFFVTDNAVMYRANREQRIQNMENQMEFWKLTETNLKAAKTPEEVAHIEKHYFERMKSLSNESIKLDKEKTTLDTRFFTDIRELPSNLAGKVAFTATNDFAADSFLVHQRNDQRWKDIPQESNAKQIFKDQKQAVTKAQQKARVNQVKKAVEHKKLEPDDPKTVVAFETEKFKWVLLPDGRYIRSSDKTDRGFVDVSKNDFIKAMKQDDLKSIHQGKDFQDEDDDVRADRKDIDRWFASWALINGWGFESYTKFKEDPEMQGVMFDRGRWKALVDETRASSIDLSVHEGNYMEPKPFGKPKVIAYKNDDNEDVEAYQIRKDLHFDKVFIDEALAFATKNKKDYPEVLVKIPHINKPIVIYVDDSVAVIVAPTGIKDKPDLELEDYPSEDFEDEEDDFTTTVDSNPSQGAFGGSDNVDPNELAERIGREL